ncbi:hypothetical protein BKA61DRAFT_280099 [Leptodontidium sp. MPI-SDFR-AT-0119]|nr:hypothetical protein BKA61DRAFT_280099 [Leptodontidium sp. MPI-SDFR-AT-0119]
MRQLVLWSVLLGWCALVVLGQQAAPTPLETYLNNYPSCATTCVIPAIDTLGYANTTLPEISSILCPDIPSRRQISDCLQTGCSYEDQIVAWPLQEGLCIRYPKDSKSAFIRNLTITMSLLASIFVLLRCYSRLYILRRFWWDDWVMLVAAVFMIVIAVALIWISTVGLGLHVWDVEAENIATIIKLYWIMRQFYVLVQVLLKVSILIFYLRVFPVRWMQISTWLIIAYLLLHGVAFFIPVIVQCRPIARLWDKRIEGSCIPLVDLLIPGAVFSILEDVVILILPIPCISKLNIGRGKKVSLVTLFSVGFVACLTSMIRLKSAVDSRDTLDETWESITLVAWSLAELTVATICVCLPSLKAILNHHMPRYFGSAKGSGYIGSVGVQRNVTVNVENGLGTEMRVPSRSQSHVRGGGGSKGGSRSGKGISVVSENGDGTDVSNIREEFNNERVRKSFGTGRRDSEFDPNPDGDRNVDEDESIDRDVEMGGTGRRRSGGWREIDNRGSWRGGLGKGFRISAFENRRASAVSRGVGGEDENGDGNENERARRERSRAGR